jgi:hypothetical protein
MCAGAQNTCMYGCGKCMDWCARSSRALLLMICLESCWIRVCGPVHTARSLAHIRGKQSIRHPADTHQNRQYMKEKKTRRNKYINACMYTLQDKNSYYAHVWGEVQKLRTRETEFKIARSYAVHELINTHVCIHIHIQKRTGQHTNMHVWIRVVHMQKDTGGKSREHSVYVHAHWCAYMYMYIVERTCTCTFVIGYVHVHSPTRMYMHIAERIASTTPKDLAPILKLLHVYIYIYIYIHTYNPRSQRKQTTSESPKYTCIYGNKLSANI